MTLSPQRLEKAAEAAWIEPSNAESSFYEGQRVEVLLHSDEVQAGFWGYVEDDDGGAWFSFYDDDGQEILPHTVKAARPELLAAELTERDAG